MKKEKSESKMEGVNTDTKPEGDKTVYEYALLRYVPDIERGEFLNIGLMMMCKRHRWIKVCLNIDEERIRSCFPKADVALLKKQAEVFRGADVPERDLPVEERYRWMAAVKSAIIQTSPSHPGILLPDPEQSPREQLEAQFNHLSSRLL